MSAIGDPSNPGEVLNELCLDRLEMEAIAFALRLGGEFSLTALPPKEGVSGTGEHLTCL